MFSLFVTVPIQNQIDQISPIQNLGEYVSNVAGLILVIASLATFAYLVYGGLTYVMSGGDKSKIEESRNRITHAVIGLAITAAAWAIFLLADFFFGLNIANQTSSTNTFSSGSASTGGSTGGTPTTPAPTPAVTTACAGGLSLGQTGTYGGVSYLCQAANIPCGNKNPDGFPYPYNCPVKCAGSKTASCS